MRIEEFKMERMNLVQIGEEVEIEERSTDAFFYYLLLPASAMSGNYKTPDRIKSRKGIVHDIKETEKGFFVEIEFDE